MARAKGIVCPECGTQDYAHAESREDAMGHRTLYVEFDCNHQVVFHENKHGDLPGDDE